MLRAGWGWMPWGHQHLRVVLPGCDRQEIRWLQKSLHLNLSSVLQLSLSFVSPDVLGPAGF